MGANLNPWDYAEKSKSEHSEQVALFMWANMAARYGLHAANDRASYTIRDYARQCLEAYGPALPVLSRLFAIKNAGHGDAIRGAMSKAEGVKAGVPDIMLPVAAPTSTQILSFGLWIELKRLKSERGAAGTVAEVQTDWASYLTGAGYKVETCYGWLEARAAIISYLGLAKPEPNA